MRNSDFLNSLEKNFHEQYLFLREKVLETNEKGERKYFIGFRKDYISLYYKGMSVAKIKKGPNNSIKYIIDKYYLEGTDIHSPLDFKHFGDKNIFDNIISQIEKHVNGFHGVNGKHQREKECQQWLINSNNINESEWYFLDMEYVYDEDPYGRPDLIAVKRRPNENGKHEVALIELKIRRSQYSGINETYKNKVEEKVVNAFERLKKNLYDQSADLKRIKYKSGIVSHIADYLRFLYNDQNYLVQMRQEIVEMICANRKLGLIEKNNSLYGIESIDNLADKPIIYVLSYTYVPSHPDDKKEKDDIKSMKQSFFNYLYGKRTKFGLVDLLNENQIDGLIKDEEGFKNAIKDNSVTKIERCQIVNNKAYNFVFSFKDPDDESSPAWDCL